MCYQDLFELCNSSDFKELDAKDFVLINLPVEASKSEIINKIYVIMAQKRTNREIARILGNLIDPMNMKRISAKCIH